MSFSSALGSSILLSPSFPSSSSPSLPPHSVTPPFSFDDPLLQAFRERKGLQGVRRAEGERGGKAICGV